MKSDFALRNMEMHSMFKGGKTLEEIGRAHGLTRQRVHQIIKSLGVRAEDGGAMKKAADARASRKSRLDAYSLLLRGMAHEEFKKIPRSAKRAYLVQRANANKRGIDWSFNLKTWWDVWQDSGKWQERGRGKGYVMARKGDAGPYCPSNVYICTGVQNSKDSYVFKPSKNRRRPAHWRPALTSAVPVP